MTSALSDDPFITLHPARPARGDPPGRAHEQPRARSSRRRTRSASPDDGARIVRGGRRCASLHGVSPAGLLGAGALPMRRGHLAAPRARRRRRRRRGATEHLADFFGRTKGITRLVPASEVWESIHSGTNRYFVVDVRPADDYAKGHVPGALSLPIDVLFRPESLAKLPARGKPILLVCKSGHTESMALGGLAALGYEPWVMRFGMIGWNAETTGEGRPARPGRRHRPRGGRADREVKSARTRRGPGPGSSAVRTRCRCGSPR